MRKHLVSVAAVSLIVVLSGAVLSAAHVTAQGATVETEVRITAQRLADGRTEFALQHRESDGEWSERVLPRARFFPASIRVGRWLVSTPLTVRAAEASADSEGTEVRITAQRLADGRTEFALQHRERDGDWSQRDLPRARFFPASVSVGRWLVSTPLAVEAPQVEASPFVGSPGSDRAALVALYEATDGENWRANTNWLTDAPLGEWHGVTTYTDGRVAWLYLGANELSGPIPPELGRLTFLVELELSANPLQGAIPPELGDLNWLTDLSLVSSQLNGPIPSELGNLASLTQLHLSHNELDGPIPPELGNLSSLRSLFLDSNQLSGPIPAELGNLISLDRLRLDGNALSGPIPPELGNLTSLTELYLSHNELDGPIPPELGDLSSLRFLWLNENQLSGPIPSELGALTSLELLWLEGNELSGPIPPQLGNLASLVSLALSRNRLTGAIPPELGNLTALLALFLNDNDLSGPIPAELGVLSGLTQLQLAGNEELSGCVPLASWGAQLYDLIELGLPFCE